MLTLRFAYRQLIKSPVYSAVAILILAFGIGINSSMFSLLNAVLFHAAPYPDANRLVQLVAHTPRGLETRFSAQEVTEIREQQPPFTALMTFAPIEYILSSPLSASERVGAVMASAELFDTLQTQPFLGRKFREEETQPGHNRVVLLSYGFWQDRFGSDVEIVGKNLELSGEKVTVVGVMPPGFDYPRLWGETDLWRPLNFTPKQRRWRDHRAFGLMGRLPPRESANQAAAALAPLGQRLGSEHPDIYAGVRFEFVSLNQIMMDALGRKMVWMMMGLAGFVLVIACANLANLQLARTTLKLRDLAIRSALGASRSRLISEQLAECILLAATGGLGGLVLAAVSNHVVENSLTLGGAPGALDVQLNATTILLTVLLAVITGITFGIVPAYLASRLDTFTLLKSQGRSSSSSRGVNRLRRALIVAEISLTLILLSGAAMMQRGFATFLDHKTGWDDDRIVSTVLSIPQNRYSESQEKIALFKEIERRMNALPGVESSALASSLPIYGYSSIRPVMVDGQTPVDAPRLPQARHVMISASYFSTVGIPLVAGRLFAEDIQADDPRVVIVNESLAQQLWPGQSPLGQRLSSINSGSTSEAEVIGVVRDVEAAASVRNPSSQYTVYKPNVQEAWGWTYIVVRSSAPASLIEPMRRTMLELDPELPPGRVATVSQFIEENQSDLKLAGNLLAVFGGLGLILAAIGVYAVTANLVAQRRGEFGIRMALGAQNRNIMGIVLRQGMWLCGIGLLMGLGGAIALGRFLQSLLPRLVAVDPFAIGGTALILAAIALIACWVPARAATRVDPITALRID